MWIKYNLLPPVDRLFGHAIRQGEAAALFYSPVTRPSEMQYGLAGKRSAVVLADVEVIS